MILDFAFTHGMTGLHILEQLRQDPHTQRLPVVVCSVETRVLGQQRETLRQLGYGVLEQPFDLDRLLDEIATLLQRAAPR